MSLCWNQPLSSVTLNWPPLLFLSSVSWVTALPVHCTSTMVDMESHYHPPSPLEDTVLGSPLCADEDFMGGMEDLQVISQSINNNPLRSFDVPEYQSSSNGSEGSTILGNDWFWRQLEIIRKWVWGLHWKYRVKRLIYCRQNRHRIGHLLFNV